MKKLLLTLAFILCSSIFAVAQPGGPASQIRFGTSDPATCTANTGAVFYNTTSELLKSCTATNTWTAIGGSIDGSGAANRVAYWSDADTLSSAATLTSDGTFIGIGTNVSATGVVRLANTGAIVGRNAANSADIEALRINAFNDAYLGSSVSAQGGKAAVGLQNIGALTPELTVKSLTANSAVLALYRSTANENMIVFTEHTDNLAYMDWLNSGVSVIINRISSTSALDTWFNSGSNVIIGATAAGATAAKNFFLGSGTAPTSSPADGTALWVADTAAGDANLYSRNEAGRVEQITGLTARVATQFDSTNETPANITDLSRNVEAGKSYSFEAHLITTSDIGGGIKVEVSGTATATAIVAEVLVTNAGATTQGRVSALDSSVGVTAVTAAKVTIIGTITVNAAGTLTIQASRNAAVGTTSVLVGSFFVLLPTENGSIGLDHYLAAYNGQITGNQKIGFAQSDDEGATFYKLKENPRIDVGASGTFDDDHIAQPWLIKVSGTYYCYYSAWDGANYRIGLATSVDGTVWIKQGQVLGLGTGGAWDDSRVYFPVVLHEPGDVEAKRWKMWYLGSPDNSSGQIGYATSADGISWAKFGSNPVVAKGSAGQFDEEWAIPGAIYKSGATYYIFYEGYPAGSATSKIGIVSFADPEGAYTKGAGNPYLSNRGTSTQALTANLSSGTKVVAVADTSVFVANEAVMVYDDVPDKDEVNYVQTIDSSTQITLRNNTVFTYNTASNATISSVYKTKITPRSVITADDGSLLIYGTAYEIIPSRQREVGVRFTATNPTTGWAFDFARGILLTLKDSASAWDKNSAENTSIVIK